MNGIIEAQSHQAENKEHLIVMETLIATHATRFEAIHPFLVKITELGNKLMVLDAQQASVPPPILQPSDPWLNQFGNPSQNTIPVVTPISSPTNAVATSSDNEARFKTLERMVDSLEKCIVGDGVRIGRFLFQSQEDLRVWLVSHVPNNRFGLFLDGVSIFDFLAQSHVDNQDNMAHMYNSQKNGFETIYESRAISSMQNLFPNLFGKSGSDGMDTSKTLPAIQNGDKWNSKGVTGLQLQVERELPNVDMQFRNSISATFDSNPEARDLALELLYRSKKFALDLCNFIQRDYDFWKHKGYGKTEAWELTCLSVHRIFEDIHVVRVCGHDSRDLKNPSFTATQVLWATLRSHIVMEEYSRRNFFEHSSISAVVARHLASHHFKPDATLEVQLKKLEDTVLKLSAKVDGIESRLFVVESKNGISPPKKVQGGGKNKNKDHKNQKDQDSD